MEESGETNCDEEHAQRQRNILCAQLLLPSLHASAHLTRIRMSACLFDRTRTHAFLYNNIYYAILVALCCGTIGISNTDRLPAIMPVLRYHAGSMTSNIIVNLIFI